MMNGSRDRGEKCYYHQYLTNSYTQSNSKHDTVEMAIYWNHYRSSCEHRTIDIENEHDLFCKNMVLLNKCRNLEMFSQQTIQT